MKTVLNKGNLGIVLNMRTLLPNDEQSPLSAHLILNRCVVDDDGNICLTVPVGFHDILDHVDVLKAELDSLANETVLWLARNIAFRRARFSVISNDM